MTPEKEAVVTSVEGRGKREEGRGPAPIPSPEPMPAPSWLGLSFAGVISAWSHRSFGVYVPDQAMKGLIAHLDAWLTDVSQGSTVDGEVAGWLAATWGGEGRGKREEGRAERGERRAPRYRLTEDGLGDAS